jgi:antitoxin ParD1/3/4
MNVSLTPELEKFVAKQVDSGMYQTASEVIRAGLRKLKDEPPARLRTVKTLEELDALILDRIARADRGKVVDGQKARAEFEKFIKSRQRRG